LKRNDIANLWEGLLLAVQMIKWCLHVA